MTEDSPLPIYVGFDHREKEAYDVCTKSISKRASIPYVIHPLDLHILRDKGHYWRAERRDGNQRYDMVDGKPFSTDFSFSRFLVPYLCGYRGWAVFMDCDFLVLEDIAELLALKDDKYAVQVVKHRFTPAISYKMDGQWQMPYPRKNWSSLILWNCSHGANQVLTREVVNSQTGSWLHGFSWLENEQIGPLPEAWNWLVGHSKPKALHFTNGVPNFPGYEMGEFAQEWHREYWRGKDAGKTSDR
jgi:hypothetical protein